MLRHAPVVETLLRRAFGVEVDVARWERLQPWYVHRCHLTGPPGVPGSVIVKWGSRGAEWSQGVPRQVFAEHAALEFLAELELGFAPRLVACDMESGVLVLEDLTPTVTLASVLEGSDHAASTAGLAAFTRALATLSAATIGLEDTYYTRRRALAPLDLGHERGFVYAHEWREALRIGDRLGVAISHSGAEEVATVESTLTEPGPFLAFSNGDPGVNNFLVDQTGGGRIIDFECARYHHALIDLSCLYVPGPMWITVSDPVSSGLEALYRTVLSHGVPEAEDDDVFGLGLAAACMAWAMVRLLRLPKLDARPGDDSRIQMISTLESAAHAADAHGTLPHLAGWSREVGAVLRRRWPDADVDMSQYPDYTRRR